METKITSTELAKSLSDVLNRVKYRGERFVVTRGGETIGIFAPAGPTKSATWADLIDRLEDIGMPGDGFADDLEAIIAEQDLESAPDWPN